MCARVYTCLYVCVGGCVGVEVYTMLVRECGTSVRECVYEGPVKDRCGLVIVTVSMS